MKVTLAVVGRLKESYLVEAEEEYRKRLRPYCTLAVVEHRDEAALLASLPERAHVYAFDERGDAPTSVDFSRDVLGHEEQRGGGAPVYFLVGGADGHSDAVRARAVRLISFGRLTIAHRLVRILVLEQLYRCYKILRGEPYHRD
ncbi:MAG: 23S rRNA (pseudouridine(1915)-N(3))-methyltransferase RlmH [Deltaproteobacteria bacterium]|nr:23S rRNA (pseudouridine(1915)-N(3))-methyltransferase RlmH [Deltaproteobacteria bacterium]